MLDDNGHMEPTDVDRDLDVDIAVRWGAGYDIRLHSYVKLIATPKGGTHVAGFERALTKTFGAALQNTGAKVGEEVVKDGRAGGHDRRGPKSGWPKPQFEGQTKGVRGRRPVSGWGPSRRGELAASSARQRRAP